jgi:nucleotide-binding universal stress UspA family protein
MHKRVLVPLESSAVLDSVVSAILKVAGVGRVEVALLRVMRPPPTDAVRGSRHELGDRVFARMEEEAHESMARIGVQLRARGVQVSAHVRWGPASHEILETARETEADFIAMPMPDRAEPGARPFDLVAEAVLCRATVPVLMVPPPARKREARRLGLMLRAGAA